MKTNKYKRLELYLWWKCNQKCFFCVEMPIMVKHWDHVISNEEMFVKLVSFRKKWYNHVTFLWWEPTIQKNYLFSIKLAKQLWYKVLVTTNALMYQYEKFSKKTLKYIDDLIISIPCIDSDLQKIITDTKNSVDFDKVFTNIRKYWDWNLLKINTVIHKKNINHLELIFKIMNLYKIKEISLTYPEPQENFYWTDFLKENTLLKYSEINLLNILHLAKKYYIIIKIVDIPFCIIWEDNIKLTDDFDYSTRLKIDQDLIKQDRNTKLPRSRILIPKCSWCKYSNVCWGIHKSYIDIFWDSEIIKF